jgi:hypothetical protein
MRPLAKNSLRRALFASISHLSAPPPLESTCFRCVAQQQLRRDRPWRRLAETYYGVSREPRRPGPKAFTRLVVNPAHHSRSEPTKTRQPYVLYTSFVHKRLRIYPMPLSKSLKFSTCSPANAGAPHVATTHFACRNSVAHKTRVQAKCSGSPATACAPPICVTHPYSQMHLNIWFTRSFSGQSTCSTRLPTRN